MSDMAPISSDWQSSGNLSDSLWFMVERQLMCDVIFEVGKEYERIGAHSSVLAARSSVFFKQFSNNIPNSKEIELEETQPRHFMLFLKYLYTGKVDIPGSDNEALMAIAEKYKVTPLSEMLLTETFKTMTPEKFCVFVKNYDTFSQQLQAKCLNHVFTDPEPVFKCTEFEVLPYSLLLELIKSEYLVLDEELICTSVLLWATRECETSNTEVNGENQRAVLKDVLQHVRFALLTQDFFTENISEKGLLTSAEEVSFLKFFLTKKALTVNLKPRQAPEEPYSLNSHELNPPPSLSFSSLACSVSQNNAKKEDGASTHVDCQTSKYDKTVSSKQKFQIMRFKYEGQGWGYRNKKMDAVAFSSSRRIKLESIYIYGSSKLDSKVNVYLEIKDDDRDIFRVHTTVVCTKKNEKMYEILLENDRGSSKETGVVVENQKVYHIVVSLNAETGHYGKGGASTITDGDVKISFIRSKFSTNNTTESIGQIPGFRYALC